LLDELRTIDGLAERWGRSVFNCPYCDGWEVQNRPLAALGNGPAALRLALQLTGWTSDIVLCTNGPANLDAGFRQRFAELNIPLREEPIVRLEGPGTELERIVFGAGAPLARRGAFLHAVTHQQTAIASQLGCTFGEDGLILTNEFAQTDASGVYAAGDNARRASQPMGVAQVVVAAAAGTVAAMAIDIELRSQHLGVNLMTLSLSSPPVGTSSAR
jgi:thioredoxin reductase